MRTSSRTGHCAKRTANRPGNQARSLGVAPFGVLLGASLPRSEQQGTGALRSPLSLRGWVRSTPTPSALKWLKSSLEKLSEKGCEQRSDREFGGVGRQKWTEK